MVLLVRGFSTTMRSSASLLLRCGARRGFATPPPPPPPPAQPPPPDAETVKNLAESARMQENMWRIFVPERGVRFGDQRFWVLVGVVGALHMYANYREGQRGAEPELPVGAVRRLPDGRLLMVDGSISAKGVDASSYEHRLNKAEEQSKGVVNNLVRSVKDAA
jgi:hypothetical protein